MYLYTGLCSRPYCVNISLIVLITDCVFSRIRDTSSVSLPSPRLADPRLSPTHRASTLTWQMTDHTKPRQGKGDAPVIPPRSARSLMDPGSGVKPDPTPIIPSNQVAEENPYLRIVGSSE